MHSLARIVIASSLASLASLSAGCGATGDRPTAQPAGASAASGASACGQQAAELGSYLESLDRARGAIAADPLAVRNGAALSPRNAVAVTGARLIAPVPAGVTVEIGRDRIYMAGEVLASTEDYRRLEASELEMRLGTAICLENEPDALRDVIVVAHPDAPWGAVQRIVELADAAGAARVLFAVATPSGVTIPPASELAVAARLDTAGALAACPGLAEAITGSGADSGRLRQGAVASVYRGCQCVVPADKVRALAYEHSGLSERQGQIPAVVEMSFVDARAPHGTERKIISAKRSASWSSVHHAVFAELERGGAFVAATNSSWPPNDQLMVPSARTVLACQARVLQARAVAEDRERAKEQARLAAQRAREEVEKAKAIERNRAQESDRNKREKDGFGFGRSAFGAGGSGTGWGTIGTGRYGTIGHGSGTCCGAGSRSSSSKPKGGNVRRYRPPQLRIGKTVVNGPLDKNIVRRYIRRKLPRIKYCYEKHLGAALLGRRAYTELNQLKL